MLTVRDLHGRPRFVLDDDLSVARDDSGKVVAQRASGADEREFKLACSAAARMRERPVLMDLGVGDVSKPATQAAYGMPGGAEEFVADIASPVREVSHATGYWYVENVADAIELVVLSPGRTAGPTEVQPGLTPTLFSTVGYALAAKLPRQLVQNADFDVRAIATRRLTDALRRLRESRVATLLTNAANWPTANKVAATAKWNGGTNPAQLTDLFAALKASYLPADTLVLPEIAAQYFHYTPAGSTGAQIRDFVQGGGQLPRIAYARAKQMVGGSPAYVWMPTGTGNVALVRTSMDPDRDVPSSVTFRWLGDDGVEDGQRVEGVLVREFFSKQEDSYWLVVAHDDIEVQPSSSIGALITGALA